MCLTPITLKKNYKAMENSDRRKRFDGGIAHTVPCGKCPECLRRRQSGWTFRLLEEVKVSESAVFVTLTYADEFLPLSFNGIPTLDKKDFQKFMKRLRKSVKNAGNDSPLKYYACGEYGTRTKRPHYHAIIFNLPQTYIADLAPIFNTWNRGRVSVDECNIATIQYVTKYVMKGRFEPEHELDDRQPEFSLMSKKLGLSHLTPQMVKYYRENFISYARLPQGTKIALPRYFRERVFNKEERKLLNELAAEEAENVFIEEFGESYKKETEWKIDQFRKANKLKIIKRQRL